MNTQVKRRKKLSATETRNLQTLLLLSVFEPQDIGARIATARKEAGLTQEELADLVGVSTRSLQGYEAGEVLPYRHLSKFADVLQRTVPWLLHGEQAADESTNAERLDRIETSLAEIRGMLAAAEQDEDPPSDEGHAPPVSGR